MKKFSYFALLILGLLPGCAFGGYGRVPMPGTGTALQVGDPLEDVVRQCGAPEKHFKRGDVETLTYVRKSGWWVYMVFFGFNFGQCFATDVELDFEGGRLVYQRVVPAGSTTGIYLPPGITGK